jgi:hypothetical protein
VQIEGTGDDAAVGSEAKTTASTKPFHQLRIFQMKLLL